ncbi:SDR family oxidoreductase [Beggiatoa leptomitoformis]|uniref:SDR family NAD(P)-dependent oxidoreductase n=1 Tax=Beggiatoa leptomitoformis TaxID=288004 RepID=A0A2N9YAH3_9GAMM|nr:SDR family oxidoreductase [Beggiatoa leptomitoformis]ALG67149.1 SDR family NAD(P)-dependent oxidoreductase [Beggiatoa leptomitoformis]AUI67451.1 SDR family NAD(P)-dependent oxidoreductase [Beggiatoa leptomitoformis]
MQIVKRNALVTGANRGLGLETCKQLAALGIQVILTCRDAVKGEAVVKQLCLQGLDIVFHPLDVTSDDSVATLKQFVENQYGKLDILVNNAGIFPDSRTANAFDSTVESLRTGMETNTYGAFRLCQAFIPLMQKKGYGRVVNVSSGMGQLSAMSGGFPSYRLSKTALNAVTRIFANETQEHNILVNSVCPGWVRTDMGGAEAERDVSQGVETIVWLATLIDGSETGKFFRDKQVIEW